MYEADELCQRIAVIADGRFVASGTPRELKARVLDRTVIELETFGVTEPTLERLRSVAGVASLATETRDQAEVLVVQSRIGAEIVPALLQELNGTSVGKVITREPTLEDAYVELVGAA
jgi:ABC-2 type transport system ATP-binding protein